MSATILLVEDNEQNRYLATFLLQKSGYTVVHAANGEAALERIAEGVPDLILMDIQMPKMDGYEAAARIRTMPGLENIPLIAVTSFAMLGDREKALRMGFAGYIEKPISPETFVAEVARFLPEKAQSS
ncbi:MAG TPA: response regulator [Chthoniobacteraceae bacterium]|jgi:two-component system cell cycle response regulator DivK